MVDRMYVAIRIRGSIGLTRDIEDTLKMLRLTAVNRCILASEKPESKGMLEKVKDWITWGEVDKETLVELLRKRLRLYGNKRIDEKILKETTKFSSFEEFAEALLQEKLRLKEIDKLQPVFGLTPPSKGFKSVRDPYPSGDLGYRGKEINELLKRMV